MNILVFLDSIFFILNIVLFYLFLKNKSIFQINLIILINASRLLVTFFITDKIYYLNHFFPVILLITINFFDTEKLLTNLFLLQNNLKILILLFLFIFTYKENFLIIHPGIGGWTYEGEQSIYVNENNFIVENDNNYLELKNEIKYYFEDQLIVGFDEGYLDVNEVEVAETNLGQFILNDGDLHIVFPDVLFANLDTNHSEQIKTSILEKTLCDRLNGKQFLMTKKLSYPDHAFYFLLAPTPELCDQAMNIYSIDKYRIYSNIEDNRYKVKKIEKIND